MKPAWRPRSDTLGNNELEMIIKEDVVRWWKYCLSGAARNEFGLKSFHDLWSRGRDPNWALPQNIFTVLWLHQLTPFEFMS